MKRLKKRKRLQLLRFCEALRNFSDVARLVSMDLEKMVSKLKWDVK
jgi:hypothetical protein